NAACATVTTSRKKRREEQDDAVCSRDQENTQVGHRLRPTFELSRVRKAAKPAVARRVQRRVRRHSVAPTVVRTLCRSFAAALRLACAKDRAVTRSRLPL